MKKILKFTALSAVLLMLAGGFVSCNRDNDEPKTPEPELPSYPESPFYFECYVDGERFVQRPGIRLILEDSTIVPSGTFAHFETRGSYDWVGIEIMQIVGIETSSQMGTIVISIQNFLGEGRYDTIFLQLNNELWKIFDCEHSWVVITEFDTINQTVSGMFQFVTEGCLIYVHRPGMREPVFADIRITEGRFYTPYFTRPHPSHVSHDPNFQILNLLNFYTLKNREL